MFLKILKVLPKLRVPMRKHFCSPQPDTRVTCPMPYPLDYQMTKYKSSIAESFCWFVTTTSFVMVHFQLSLGQLAIIAHFFPF